ncbi:MAG: Holliday junction branch migration protein RuvA [Gammaproteobacteria bacterium]|nr:Holliday junction branch migration protein RuvA [Gammaproteobacteria bacterium]MCW8910390.1 Holliday junction branch migration protein RuvA [Gammaproteobacteria bacterium]MCW9004622.1 Holliday junction branch migration protein RuvA [Gammaproteobacteria bacterium]MCW9056673.1 Holliday junction branch migration protein RuvA [Gammaproteobacteria bacterium]
MIGRLRGKIINKQPPQLLIDVQGVGYEVDAPMSTFYQLPNLGEDVTLHTHLVVREDAHMLYGFASETERSLFRNLIKINGVGAKLALTILSGMDANEFTRCVLDNDAAALVRMPGVGKKTAERLIIELRDRLQEDSSPSSAQMTSSNMLTASASNPVSDAVSALIALGYKPQEASRMVRVLSTEGLEAEDIIRQSLQAAVSK